MVLTASLTLSYVSYAIHTHRHHYNYMVAAADLVPARCDGGGNSPIVFGEGPACRSCHVYIDPESLAKLPPKSANEVKLSYWIETKTEHTRFSCEIELTKDLDNMTVVIPEYTRADVA